MEDNSLVCSGCLTKQPTVDRDMFDGLCADCTNKSLYDDDFEKRAKERSYSEEDMKKYASYILTHTKYINPKEWFEQFKKK